MHLDNGISFFFAFFLLLLFFGFAFLRLAFFFLRCFCFVCLLPPAAPCRTNVRLTTSRNLQENPRTTGILAVAKANNLDIELVETVPATAPADYKNINKLGKIPTFVGADGFTLSECIAIYVYGKFCA